MSTIDTSKARAELEHERSDLTRQLTGLESDGSAAPDFDENFADSAQVAAEQGENATLAASFREQLSEVERALARIEGDTYGTCETCGDAIAKDRIEAMPATRFCIKHA